MTGRNDPCPCGTGKKFKKCHGDPRRTPPSIVAAHVREAMARQARQKQDRAAQFGHVRPIIHTDFQGQKVVAVGNTVYHSAKWRTFPDFLSFFIKKKIPEAWYKSQLELALEDRHPLAQWYIALCDFQARNNKPDADGLFSGEPDGPSLAFLALAYALHTLEADLLVQERLIRRLLHRDQFQGAHYEIIVAAAMIRAGFSLEMEDESDSTAKHPELVATHKLTGIQVDVEAKSRHRGGVLGQPGDFKVRDTLAQDIRGKFAEAIAKARGRAQFVFIDANLPPELAAVMVAECGEGLHAMVPKVSKPISEHGVLVGHPHNLLMITNIPLYYGAAAQPLPAPIAYAHCPLPQSCRHPVPPALIEEVVKSLKLHGKIPNTFE